MGCGGSKPADGSKPAAGAAPAPGAAPSNAPHLIYAPLAGRGELIRLIAAAGGVKITELSNMANFGQPTISETGESKADYVSPSGMPLLKHGDLKISQSGAIETYIAAIAPRYSKMTMQQHAVDDMYQAIKEEVLFGAANAVFTTNKTDENKAKADIIALFDKWFAIFEEKAPDASSEAFIQGLGFPTAADLVLFNITKGFMPFGAAKKIAGYDFDKFPKVKALCDRVSKDANVAEYLKSTTSLEANPMGL
jgi:hypothetical protein